MQLINLTLSLSAVIDNFTGIVEFLPAALYGYYISDGELGNSVQFLVTMCLAIWSVRLGAFLIYRFWHRPVVDTRLGSAEKRRYKFICILWPLHGTWGFVVSFPVTFINASCGGDMTITSLDVVGACIWAFGFIIEAYADQTKLREYARDKTHYYKMNGNGLWKFSRNPNFFGEFACWTGVAIIATNHLASHSGWLVLIIWFSPILTLILMLFEAASMSEAKNNLRYKKTEGYL